MIRAIVFISILSTLAVTIDNGPAHCTTTAKSGDGAYAILRRYHLLDHLPNLDKFYELNSLSPDKPLIIGKEYKLPVLIYPFDGTSIRSTIGIDDWDLALRIQEYNERLVQSGILTVSFKESGDLWVPVCYLTEEPEASSEVKTANTRTVDIPLFGPSNSEVEITSDILKGKVFYIISGHGGPDPGALGETPSGHTLCEDEYAYDVSLRLARKLIQHGATVEVIVQDPHNGIRDDAILTCDKSELSMGKARIPIRQLIRLQQRVHAVNEEYNQHRKNGFKDHTVVCIHVDSRQPQRRQDVFFYYYEPSKTGKKLANKLQKTFKEKYEHYRPGRGYTGTVSSRNLYVLKHTDPPAVYVELANIQNAADLRRILPKENRQALANWLFEGLTSK